MERHYSAIYSEVPSWLAELGHKHYSYKEAVLRKEIRGKTSRPLARSLPGVQNGVHMGYVRTGIFVLVVLAFGILSHSASATCTANPCTYSNGNNQVKVQYYVLPNPPTVDNSVTQIAGGSTHCPSPNTLGCGYALVSSVLGSSAAWVNWQGGTLPSGNSNPLTFTLGSGAALHAYDPMAPCASCGVNGSSKPWRSPTADYGYILSANDTASSATAGIKITPTTSGHYFSALSFYWGSVDPWNEIIFKDSNDTPTASTDVTITGSNLANQGVSVPCTVPANCTSTIFNNTDVVVDFKAGGDSWSSIQLLSCNGAQTPTCQPAFEIDNLQYILTTSTGSAAVSFSDGNQSPVPEPTGLLLMSTGVMGIAGWLRRKVRF